VTRRWRLRLVLYPLLAVGLAGVFGWLFWTADPNRGQQRVVFASTPPEAVEKMLELAEVTKDDVVYDLGCGDGRILVAAAKKTGCRAVGVEIKPELVELARQNARDNGVEGLVEIRQGDLFEADFREATVVALYLLPDLNVRLIPQLRKLRPGARIVSFNFDMPGVPPKQKVTWEVRDRTLTVYLWTTPLEGDGR
jgi:SAM-dependent methyltransferase